MMLQILLVLCPGILAWEMERFLKEKNQFPMTATPLTDIADILVYAFIIFILTNFVCLLTGNIIEWVYYGSSWMVKYGALSILFAAVSAAAKFLFQRKRR